MSDAAEPVSPLCWVRSRNRLGGPTKLPMTEAGRIDSAKAYGLSRPNTQTRAPDRTDTAKQTLMSVNRLNLDDSLTYRMGPAIIVIELNAKK